MSEPSCGAVVVSSETELPQPGRHWGHGGWVPPAEREALDWLSLFRLLGWRARVAALGAAPLSAPSVLVLAVDPDGVDDDAVARLEALLRTVPALVICRAPAAGVPLACLTGATRGHETVLSSELEWIGAADPGAWNLAKGLGAGRLDWHRDVAILARLGGEPCVVSREVGVGRVATLAFHASAARDEAGAITALLRRLLVTGRQEPAAWLDLENTLVLRLDDPGGAQNVYCREWCYAPLGRESWRALGEDLRRREGRLSVLYSAGWVDDGDSSRGRLVVDGCTPQRIAGAVHPSPLVVYEDRTGHARGRTNDYRAEFEGIQELRAAGLAEVELHGYTHMHPDPSVWLAADDRYSSMAWFRELGPEMQQAIDELPKSREPVTAGIEAIQRWFGVRPTTLVPPGDLFSDATLDRARDAAIILVASYYLALRHGNGFIWSQHVCAPYLDLPAGSWFQSGLPVVGYFHDYEPSVYGTDWVTKWLDEWQAVGAARLIDFRELSGALGRRVSLQQLRGATRLVVETVEGPPLVRPMPVQLTLTPALERRGSIDALVDDLELTLALEHLRPGVGRVLVPSSRTLPSGAGRGGRVAPSRRLADSPLDPLEKP